MAEGEEKSGEDSSKPRAAKSDAVAAGLGVVVGGNLRRLRTRAGYSLERLSQQSGVSRAMIGQIETGRSAPTINILWKLATALDVPFSNLISAPRQNGTTVLRRENAKILISSDSQFTSRALFPFDENRNVEFYELTIGPRHTEHADAHAAGTVENLVVLKGAVEIGIGKDAPTALGEGDAIVFIADVPHRYRNLGADAAILYLVMTYAEKSS